MTEIIPLLVHLYPPELISKFELSRFSPYFYRPFDYGITNVRPLEIYKYIFPFDDEMASKLSYYFDHDYLDKRDIYGYTKELNHKVDEWKRLWEGIIPELVMLRIEEHIIMIKDTRPISTQQIHFLTKEYALIYSFCEEPRHIDHITKKILDVHPNLSKEDVIRVLEDLIGRKLLLKNDNHYLSLATLINK